MSIVEIDRALHEIRSGRSIEIDGQNFIHPEFINDDNWQDIASRHAKLIITAKRAEAIFKKDFSENVTIDISDKSLEEVTALICGMEGFDDLLNEPINSEQANSALELARIAEILPTMILFNGNSDIKIKAANVISFKENTNQSLKLVTDTKLNLADAEKASVQAFRPANGGSEHLAIIIGNVTDNPLIRLHSSCYTGDLLGSLSCDCGDQLRECIRLMNKDYLENNGGGVIVYLIQEGRGIGLINKLRAYNLQHDGMDTVEANEFLGFDDEERGFEPAAVILKELGINKVRLVTNNPKKSQGLAEHGIEVAGRVSLVVTHEHNQDYMQTKAKKSGHIID